MYHSFSLFPSHISLLQAYDYRSSVFLSPYSFLLISFRTLTSSLQIFSQAQVSLTKAFTNLSYEFKNFLFKEPLFLDSSLPRWESSLPLQVAFSTEAEFKSTTL